MALTSIGSQKTPGRPIELTFEAELGLPNDNQRVCLIGHAPSGFPASGLYKCTTISNVADEAAASGEMITKGFGAESELTKMVLSAVRANAGGSTVPPLSVIALAAADTDFGTADAALTELKRCGAEFAVSCYDGQTAALRNKLKDAALTMSGAQRVENAQFGTFGVVANKNVSDPALLDKVDSQYIIGVWLRDAASAVSETVAEVAAAAAARMAALTVPFNPLDDVSVGGLDPQADSDKITKGAGLESETCLNQGWTPLYTKANDEVAFVRTVTARLSADGTGVPVVGAYYDVQDFMVLYFWRRTLFTRFSQTDMKRRKASDQAAQDILSELIRLATLFQDQGMFQAVDKLAKQFKVERNASDRHRMDYRTPVNVVPGLHVIAGNIAASTQFDTITI